MLLRSTKLYFIALLVPLFIGGCAQQPKQLTRKLTHLDVNTNVYEKTKRGITVRVKTLITKQECIDTFGKSGKYLLCGKKNKIYHKIYPIKITIDNKSNQPWHLSLSNIELKKAPIKSVLSRLHYRTGTRILLTGIPLLPVAFFGFLFGAWGLMAVIVYKQAASLLLVTAVSALLVPAAVTVPITQGVSSSYANHRITKQVEETTLQTVKKWRPWKRKRKQQPQSMIIESSQTKSTLIFVQERDYKSNFAIALQPENEAGDKLLFDVQLPTI